jgi:predicted PurR-regulated permease PerM
MDWAQILVIILSIFLALFLLLGIVLVVLLIRLTQQIRSVTESAQRTANGIEGLINNVTKFSSPGLLMKLVARQAKKFKQRKEK